MHWNGLCFFTLMCFTSQIPNLNRPDGMCTYFKSEDADRKSLVIDAPRQERPPNECIKLGPFNTILIHVPENIIGNQPISFSFLELNYDHLIVLKNALPVNFCPLNGQGSMKTISLTVIKNNNLQAWSWLRCTKFKFIRIYSCVFKPFSDKESNNMILSEHLLTLTLINIMYFDPWTDLDYGEAPNLKELSINYFEFTSLPTFHFPLDAMNSSFQKLQRLNLENNKIMNIKTDFFALMPKLKEIILESNQLTSLDLKFELEPRRLHLNDNPLDGSEKTCKFLDAAYIYYDRRNQICPPKKG